MRSTYFRDEKYDYVDMGGWFWAFKRDLEQEKEEKRHEIVMRGLKRSESFLLGFVKLFIFVDALVFLYLLTRLP